MPRIPAASLSLFIFASSLSAAPASAAPAATADAAQPQSVLPFIEDDFAGAARQALAQDRLLVVDAWAPWCHTCLSMRNFVFTDPLLRPLAERFVYLAVDTEQPKNGDFVRRFPIQSWPTLFVLDLRRGEGSQVVARYTGSMTAAELLSELEAVAKSAGPGAAEKAPRSELGEADAAAAAGRFQEAASLYSRAASRQALRPRARLGQIQALRGLGQHLACAELGDAAAAEVGHTVTAADFFAYAADCLDHVTDFNAQARLRQKLRLHLEALVRDPRAPLLPDDRSDAYGTLVAVADGLGDREGGDRYTEERLQLLTAAAAQTRTAAERATYDAHRFDCYRRLRRYAPAEVMLTASEKALPGDYNPPARLARLYFEMGRLDEALGSIDRALGLANGPRRVSMLELKSSIQHGLGQTRPAIASLKEAIHAAEASPAAASMASRVAALHKNVEALERTLEPLPALAKDPLELRGKRTRTAKVARRAP